MNKLISFFSSAVIVILFCFFAVPGKRKTNHKPAMNGFAVVELFTSEGCSSCPPADEAVIKLAKDYPDKVYILGYHVDYWNRGGWKDEFSKAAFTQRQNKYAERFSLSSIYTPQIVVNGKKEFVGSNSSLLESTVKKELEANPQESISLITSVNESDKKISVAYGVAPAPTASLNIALVQLNAATSVKGGENQGKLLHHINIIRELKTISANRSAKGEVSFAIPNGLSAKDMEIVAFLQDDDWKIIGAVSTVIN